MLCTNGFEGGYGYTPNQVGEMTLDQIFFLLCDKDVLRGSGKKRVVAYESMAVAGSLPVDSKGFTAGRDKHGNPMRAKILGKSKAARILEAQQAKKETEKQVKPKRKKVR